jgi:hypothetical protein
MIKMFKLRMIVAAAVLLHVVNSNAVERRPVQDLATVERSVAKLHSDYINAFLEMNDKAKIRNDQSLWVARLENCQKDTACLIRMNQARQKLLIGKSTAMPYVGFFEGAGGEIFLYPLGTDYMVQIRTAQSPAGGWTCQVSGIAKKAAKHLQFSAGGVSQGLRIWPNGSQKLAIRIDEDSGVLTKDFCGKNGSFAGVFRRDF